MPIDRDGYKPGLVESTAGNPNTAIGTTAIAAGFAATTPVAIFLPSLAQSLAGVRMQERLQRFVHDVSDDLEGLSDRLDEIEESQYQVINDALVAALHTLDQRKLDYLRYAIRNALNVKIEPSQSAFVARAVRDISAEEAEFLLRISKHAGIAFFDVKNPALDIITVDSGNAEGSAVDGLLSIGLLRSQSGYGGSTMKLTSNAKVICQLLSKT